jgi:hypothetical protein
LNKWAAALMIGVLASSLLVAGCGGGGDGESDAISKKIFVKEATKICADANRSLQENFTNVGNLKALTLSVLRTEVDEITALGSPSGDQIRVEAILNPMREAIVKGEAKVSGSIGEANEKLKKAEELAEQYGIEGCPLSS